MNTLERMQGGLLGAAIGATNHTNNNWRRMAAVAHAVLSNGGQFDIGQCADENRRIFGDDATQWGDVTHIPINAGSGALTKVIPLAFLHENDGLQDFWLDCRKMTRMTHGDMRASIAGYAFGRMLQWITFDPETVRDRNTVLQQLTDEILGLERQNGRNSSADTELSTMLARIAKQDGPAASLVSDTQAPGTVARAIATFYRHPHDFEAGMTEIVGSRRSGEMEQATAGALIGAHVGLSAPGRKGIPLKWQSACRYASEANILAHRLFEMRFRALAA